MLAASGYKTKKALRDAKGQQLRYNETSLFGSEFKPNGTVYVVGPSAYDRKWYAQVTLCEGRIVSVK